MSVWKSDEKLLTFASLISPSIILFDTVISSMRRNVSSPDETPRSSSKIFRCASYFQLSSRLFHLVKKHCVSCLTNKDHRLTKIKASYIIIRQKATSAHNRLFYDNGLFYTHR